VANRKILVSHSYTGGFEVNSEWILVHHVGGFKDCVGWALKGGLRMAPVRITRDGDKPPHSGSVRSIKSGIPASTSAKS